MSTACEVTTRKAAGSPMGLFERYLSVRVFLCIGAGIGLGQWLFPGVIQFVGRLEVARIQAVHREIEPEPTNGETLLMLDLLKTCGHA